MDRAQLAEFLRTRRESLKPEDLGLPRGTRRRTRGLRREEVADLCNMSVDYYSRIEQQRGPNPSQQMLAAIARGLLLSRDERDHLFHLGGYPSPRRFPRSEAVNPGMMRILARMADDTPAQVVNHLGETLMQTRLAVALLGNDSAHTGMARAFVYRWFTEPETRRIFPEEDHAKHGRVLVAHLSDAFARDGRRSRAGAIVQALLSSSREFSAIWHEHPVTGPYCEAKRIVHPELGLLEVDGQTLLDPDQSQALMVFTAAPGTESYEKLQRLCRVTPPTRSVASSIPSRSKLHRHPAVRQGAVRR